MKKTLLILSLLLSFSVHLQYAKAIVNKGVATVNDKFTFKPGQDFDIRPSQRIILSDSSIITCKKDKKIIVYSGPNNVSYSSIMEDLELNSIASDAYFDNMFSGKYVVEISGYGSVDRGLDIEKSATYFFPLDSMLVLSDSVVLEIGNSKTSFLSPIKIQDPKGELLKISTESLNYLVLRNLEPGDYHWSCRILVDEDEIEFQNYFKVPSQNERTDLLDSRDVFQGLISSFDESVRAFLMDSWLESRSYYFLD
ncbi:hypothetical protein N9O41_01255 [Crocinitomicaceae bacterium]|nr:hypothetical protein [Crocinitomicaceae bacterium]